MSRLVLHVSLVVTVLLMTAGAAAAAPADSTILLHQKGQLGPEPQSQTLSYSVQAHAGVKLGVSFTGRVKTGKATFRLIGKDNKILYEHSGDSRIMAGAILSPLAEPQTLLVQVVAVAATGKWELLVVAMPKQPINPLGLATGPLMMLVALMFVVAWKWHTRVKLRWFWAGAGVWTLGVALKIAWALLLNERLLDLLENALPHTLYVALASTYIGLLTGVFEIGVTLACALIWKRMAADPDRAVAVGIGAGAFEAFVLGCGALVLTLLVASGNSRFDMLVIASVYAAQVTPLLWLIGPAERIVAILCHIASRTLTLFSVATRRWAFFWYGFLLLSAIDAIAGCLYVTDTVHAFNMWWVELMLVPFALAGIPIVKWCLRQWPKPAQPASEAPSDEIPLGR
jgi:hypothetical protein